MNQNKEIDMTEFHKWWDAKFPLAMERVAQQSKDRRYDILRYIRELCMEMWVELKYPNETD